LVRTIATVAFIIVCLALIIVILMQEGKDAGFGTFSGQVDSYVRKNRGRTREGQLERITVILGVLFFAFAIGLCLKFFQ
jgi:preprotein translocase subunit SecG